MASIRYYGRQVVTSLLCFYMIVFYESAMGNPGAERSQHAEKLRGKNIAFYAANAELHLNLEHLTTLYVSAEKLHRNLCAIADEISDSDAPEENKRIELEGCSGAIKLVEDVIRDAKYYVELAGILDEYITLSRESKKTGTTSERAAELKNALRSLEQRFKNKEQLALHLLTYGIGEYYVNFMREAEAFIHKYAN
ncbi:hypothetical protein BBBOND_0306940 [Babesia bigemina]|uniref:Uncharacterized protein n=1 Tax=Babesia bigemina TaxID=5866 RepID=A0A061DE36_BABBI|nr:hypothetical protein BBBOND_0306940 [Babesia bigemina]CDR96790.1 hypothetical protein BBBOND_0306940 [Babesia bigemina]|eukprot:XP_012768976.1 hypothetical protein BBBOND_0306940 [Babesia bigemina]